MSGLRYRPHSARGFLLESFDKSVAPSREKRPLHFRQFLLFYFKISLKVKNKFETYQKPRQSVDHAHGRIHAPLQLGRLAKWVIVRKNKSFFRKVLLKNCAIIRQYLIFQIGLISNQKNDRIRRGVIGGIGEPRLEMIESASPSYVIDHDCATTATVVWAGYGAKSIYFFIESKFKYLLNMN